MHFISLAKSVSVKSSEKRWDPLRVDFFFGGGPGNTSIGGREMDLEDAGFGAGGLEAGTLEVEALEVVL